MWVYVYFILASYRRGCRAQVYTVDAAPLRRSVQKYSYLYFSRPFYFALIEVFDLVCCWARWDLSFCIESSLLGRDCTAA